MRRRSSDLHSLPPKPLSISPTTSYSPTRSSAKRRSFDTSPEGQPPAKRHSHDDLRAAALPPPPPSLSAHPLPQRPDLHGLPPKPLFSPPLDPPMGELVESSVERREGGESREMKWKTNGHGPSGGMMPARDDGKR